MKLIPLYLSPIGLNLGPLSQINQLNQLAAIQQAQQRMVDPRLQGVRYPGIVPQMMNPRSTAGTNMGLGVTGNPAINTVLGRALSPQILPGGGQKLSEFKLWLSKHGDLTASAFITDYFGFQLHVMTWIFVFLMVVVRLKQYSLTHFAC